MRWIVGASLRFRYIIIALACVLLVFGLLCLRHVSLDVFPEFAPPLVEVQTETPGLSAAEVESLVTIQLEDVFSSTAQLDIIRSKSVPGLSSIVLIFKPGIDELVARQLVQERLTAALRTLPTWAGMPWILQPLSATSRVMHIGLTSKKYSLTELSMITYWTIRWRLMAVPGVANVVIWGDRFQQMQIEVDPKKLKQYKLTLDDIDELTSNALDFGLLKFTESAKARVGGFIETPNQRLTIEHVLPVIEPNDLARLPIKNILQGNGSPLTLGDLGQVVWGHQPLIGDAIINGEQGLLLIVEKFPWANTLEVTQGVDDALAELKQGLPEININANIFRPAVFIETAIKNLSTALYISCFLVMLVLIAFLFEWRTTIISLIAIPLSLITAGLILNYTQTTINTMILAGFVIAIGGVVDDAIIDVENIIRRLRQNAKAHQADPNQPRRSIITIIFEASLEVRGAIIYAVLIDIAVLIPILFLTGVSGAFFKPLVLAYALALLASMIVALTVTPALCLLLLGTAPLKRESPLMHWLQRGYNRAQDFVLEVPRLIYAVIAVLILVGLIILPFLGESLFPAFKERFFLIHWVTEPGTTAAEVVRITKRLSDDLMKVPGVRSFGSHIGRAVAGEEISGVNFAENWISIDPSVDYDKTLDTVGDVVSGYPGLFQDVQTYLNERIDEVVAGSSYPITVRIFGPDLMVLRELASEITQKISKVPGTTDVHTELQVDVPHIRVEPILSKIQQYGIKPGDIRRDVGTLIAGTEVSDIHKSGRVYDIILWGTPNTRTSYESVRDLLISTPKGEAVSLNEVANVSILPTPNLISREQNSRRIDVDVDIENRNLEEVATDVQDLVQSFNFPLGYHAQVIGEYQERQAAAARLFSAALIAGVLVLLLLQAAFRKWRLAFLAFFTLPSALVGGLLAALATGGVISLGSLVGFFTVFGIAARNGIMLINHYQFIEKNENELFSKAMIIRGTRERLAPILMTALAAGLALVPLVISGNIPGQEIEYPMAIVILGGLVTSTILNLFIMPFLYYKFGKKK
jgi:CzcA family heavy metal efflux pump